MPDLSTVSLAELVPIAQITFWIMTACTIGGAVGVVSSNNLFHSALWLILSFFGVAGYYVLLSAGFLAVVQLMVYIGAIAILILFAIMFSRNPMAPKDGETSPQWWLGVLTAVALFIVLIAVVSSNPWPVSGAEPTGDTVQQLGIAFLGSYIIPFELIGLLLSVAMIGAIMLAREKPEPNKMEEVQ